MNGPNPNPSSLLNFLKVFRTLYTYASDGPYQARIVLVCRKTPLSNMPLSYSFQTFSNTYSNHGYHGIGASYIKYALLRARGPTESTIFLYVYRNILGV